MLIVTFALSACSGPTNNFETVDGKTQSVTTMNNTCLSVFSVRDIGPSSRSKYTFAQEELYEYLTQMKISSLCIPTKFGTPFLNGDWNSATGNADVGRKISIGFEKMYDRNVGGWGNVHFEFSTYDFEIGSE